VRHLGAAVNSGIAAVQGWIKTGSCKAESSTIRLHAWQITNSTETWTDDQEKMTGGRSYCSVSGKTWIHLEVDDQSMLGGSWVEGGSGNRAGYNNSSITEWRSVIMRVSTERTRESANSYAPGLRFPWKISAAVASTASLEAAQTSRPYRAARAVRRRPRPAHTRPISKTNR
jgi:hypothetical protein